MFESEWLDFMSKNAIEGGGRGHNSQQKTVSKSEKLTFEITKSMF